MQYSFSRQCRSRITPVSRLCRGAIPSSSQAFADWLLGTNGFLIGTRTDAIPDTGSITGSAATNLSYVGYDDVVIDSVADVAAGSVERRKLMSVRSTMRRLVSTSGVTITFTITVTLELTEYEDTLALEADIKEEE